MPSAWSSSGRTAWARVGVERRQRTLARRLVERPQDAGDVVNRHPGEDGRGVALAELAQKWSRDIAATRAECTRGVRWRHGPQNLRPSDDGEPADQLHQLPGGEPVDGSGGSSELQLMTSAGGEVELVPGQRLTVKAPRQPPQTKPAEHRDEADINRDHAQGAILARQLHLADAGDALLVQVHHLVIDHVARET